MDFCSPPGVSHRIWGLEKLLPIGFELGQLLIGLAHADELSADELAADAMPSVEPAILPANCDGLADEQCRFDASILAY